MRSLKCAGLRVKIVEMFCLVMGLLALAFAPTLSAFGADFPNKPITIVATTAAGGGQDLTARAFAPYLQEELKVPIIIQNNTEGGGLRGVQEVYRAKPDGYTLLINLEHRYIQGEVVSQAPYKILEFTPITCLTKVGMLVVANKTAPFNNLSELKMISKKQPISVGTAGAGSNGHFLFLRLKGEGGIPMEAIPFKGSSISLTSLLGGHIDMVITDTGSIVTYIDRLKIICTFGAERSEFFPNAPTAVEQGINIVTEDTTGILAPPKLPKEIAAVLEAAFTKARSRPEVKESMKKLNRALSNLAGEAYRNDLAKTYKVIEKYR